MDDWNDLRHLLAVAREQTLVGAARRLGVNQTTVGRRIGALEQELGSRLFNRVDQRMIPTATGEAALRTAERVEREVLGAAAEIAGSDDSLEGDVRVTSVSSIVNNVLAPQVNDLLSKFPGIHLDLLSGQGNLDLNHLEADLALRLGRPTAPNLVTKRVGALGYSVYVLARYASRSDELPWLAYSDTVEQFRKLSGLPRNAVANPLYCVLTVR